MDEVFLRYSSDAFLIYFWLISGKIIWHTSDGFPRYVSDGFPTKVWWISEMFLMDFWFISSGVLVLFDGFWKFETGLGNVSEICEIGTFLICFCLVSLWWIYEICMAKFRLVSDICLIGFWRISDGILVYLWSVSEICLMDFSHIFRRYFWCWYVSDWFRILWISQIFHVYFWCLRYFQWNCWNISGIFLTDFWHISDFCCAASEIVFDGLHMDFWYMSDRCFWWISEIFPMDFLGISSISVWRVSGIFLVNSVFRKCFWWISAICLKSF